MRAKIPNSVQADIGSIFLIASANSGSFSTNTACNISEIFHKNGKTPIAIINLRPTYNPDNEITVPNLGKMVDINNDLMRGRHSIPSIATKRLNPICE